MNNIFYSLVLSSGSKEALFLAIWISLEESPGKISNVTFSELLEVAERYGVKLTDSQIRDRVKQLEKIGVVEIVPRRERGRFDLFVYQPAPSPIDAPAKRDRETPLFDYVFGGRESFANVARDSYYDYHNENGNENESENRADAAIIRRNVESPTTDDRTQPSNFQRVETAKKSELSFPENSMIRRNEISPNKEYNINKQTNKAAIFLEEKDRKPRTDEIRERLDFERSDVKAFRTEIVTKVWEDGINPELIDRIAAAAFLGVGGKTILSVRAAVREEVDRKAAADKEFDRRGGEKKPLWKYLGYRFMRLYRNAGWVWTKTEIADEPAPSKASARIADLASTRPIPDAEPIVANPPKKDGADEMKSKSCDELEAATRGFGVEAADAELGTLVRDVQRRLKIADVWEANAIVYEMRRAARELKRRALVEI